MSDRSIYSVDRYADQAAGAGARIRAEAHARRCTLCGRGMVGGQPADQTVHYNCHPDTTPTADTHRLCTLCNLTTTAGSDHCWRHTTKGN